MDSQTAFASVAHLPSRAVRNGANHQPPQTCSRTPRGKVHPSRLRTAVPPLRLPAVATAPVETGGKTAPRLAFGSALDVLEADYRAAKAAYKAAKAEMKTGMHMDMSTIAALEQTYRAKKLRYKQEKNTAKLARVARKTPQQAPAPGSATGVPAGGAAMAVEKPSGGGLVSVAVCGGKTCKRLGADAVAACIAKGGVADAACMKQCGGMGPTIMVDGRVSKVDLNAAVRAALANGVGDTGIDTGGNLTL